MKKMFVLILSFLSFINVCKSQNSIQYKLVNDCKVIQLSVENLVTMLEMTLPQWEKSMKDIGYHSEGIHNNGIMYSPSLAFHIKGVGFHYFIQTLTDKSMDYSEIEYYMRKEEAGNYLKEEVSSFASNISEHYLGMEESWMSFGFKYKNETYGVNIFNDAELTRIKFRKYVTVSKSSNSLRNIYIVDNPVGLKYNLLIASLENEQTQFFENLFLSDELKEQGISSLMYEEKVVSSATQEVIKLTHITSFKKYNDELVSFASKIIYPLSELQYALTTLNKESEKIDTLKWEKNDIYYLVDIMDGEFLVFTLPQ